GTGLRTELRLQVPRTDPRHHTPKQSEVHLTHEGPAGLRERIEGAIAQDDAPARLARLVPPRVEHVDYRPDVAPPSPSPAPRAPRIRPGTPTNMRRDSPKSPLAPRLVAAHGPPPTPDIAIKTPPHGVVQQGDRRDQTLKLGFPHGAQYNAHPPGRPTPERRRAVADTPRVAFLPHDGAERPVLVK